MEMVDLEKMIRNNLEVVNFSSNNDKEVMELLSEQLSAGCGAGVFCIGCKDVPVEK